MPSAELNIEDRAALERYLQSQFSPAEEYEVREFEVLTGGVSGRTVRVNLSGGQEWVLKQALPKLRVEADWYADPRRIHREALGMKVLAELTPPGSIPKLIFDDETRHVLGMEAVPRPHENWKTQLLGGRTSLDYAAEFGQLLAAIHTRSAARGAELSQPFADRSYFESLRIEPYYVYSASREPRAAKFFEQLIADTQSSRIALVHGDYSPKNVLIYKEKLVLLDHEVIHWGDPAFDFGFALSHFLGKANHFWKMPNNYTQLARTFCRFYDDPTYSFQITTVQNRGGQVRHALACMLARVVGRSPLEYLTPEQRDRQREAVVSLIRDQPDGWPDLIYRFEEEIERHACQS